jgi:hypothetical protein
MPHGNAEYCTTHFCRTDTSTLQDAILIQNESNAPLRMMFSFHVHLPALIRSSLSLVRP